MYTVQSTAVPCYSDDELYLYLHELMPSYTLYCVYTHDSISLPTQYTAQGLTEFAIASTSSSDLNAAARQLTIRTDARPPASLGACHP